MNTVCVKLRMREHGNKYRKVLSTNEMVYPELQELVETSFSYTAGTVLDSGEWFQIENASQQPYAIDLITQRFETPDFELLTVSEFQKIDFLFVKSGTTIFFQKISKAKLAKKKGIIKFGENFQYDSQREEIIIHELPDAAYCRLKDTLYFRKLESITSIFKGIEDLYREATEDEVKQFLENDFITLKEGYGVSKVKTANRKRIALVTKTLSELKPEERANILSYIEEYCPDLKTEDDRFLVGDEEELRMVLFGIDQRFYTTPVGARKRIANSVIAMD